MLSEIQVFYSNDYISIKPPLVIYNLINDKFKTLQ